MDSSFAYGTHFALSVLVLPVHPIKISEYQLRLSLLRQHTRIALADVPAIPPPGLETSTGQPSYIVPTLLPTPTSRGNINLEFVETWDKELRWLEEFQIHRRVVAVIGIVDCSEWHNELKDAVAAFAELALEQAPPDVFVRRCYGFNPGEAQTDNAEGLVLVPTVGDPAFYVHTLLAEVCSGLLAGLSGVMVSFDSRQGFSAPTQGGLSTPALPTTNYFAADPAVEVSASEKLAASLDRTMSPKTISSPSRSGRQSTEGTKNRNVATGEFTDAKSRKKLPARLAKLQGDIYALSGRTTDAYSKYTEAVALAKSTGDNLWSAAAQEASIILQAYQAWLGSPPNGTSHARLDDNPSSIAADTQSKAFVNASLGSQLLSAYTHVLLGYAKSGQRNSAAALPTPDGSVSTPTPASLDGEDAIHHLVYVETCLRLLRLQVAILLCGGWNARSLSMIVTHSPAEWPEYDLLRALSTDGSDVVTRGEVLHLINVAYSHTKHASIRNRDQIRFLNSCAIALNCLKYYRKRAVFLRELGAVAATAAAQVTVPDVQPGDVVASKAEAAGSRRIISIMEEACTAYNVDVVSLSEITLPLGGTQPITPAADASSFLAFGWPDLQIAVVKDAMTAADILADYLGAIRFTMTALRRLSDAMCPPDQYKLSQNIVRLFAAVARRAPAYHMTYWGPEDLVMSIDVAGMSSDRVLTEQAEIILDSDGQPPVALQVQSPFVHSTARQVSRAQTLPTLVQDESAEFFVTLRNPFLFDLKIDSIDILTKGVTCVAHSVKTVVPAASVSTVRLSCLPTTSGTLTVQGCRIRLAGCEARYFLVPLETDGEHSGQQQERLNLAMQSERLKLPAYGRADRLPMVEMHREMTFLECAVVSPQPMLEVSVDGLINSSIVLLEGESAYVPLAISNISILRVDWVRISFADSFTSHMRELLLENEFSPSVTYDMESEILDEPVVRLADIARTSAIEAGQSLRLVMQCLGKPGLSHIKVQLDYARTNTSAPQKTRILSRQSVVPINVSVYPSVRCVSMSIIPFKTATHRRHDTSKIASDVSSTNHSSIQSALRSTHSAESCLLILEVHNASVRQRFRASLFTSDRGGGGIAEDIAPGDTINLIVPTPRISLSAAVLRQGIPSLSDKQFIVGKEKLSPLDLELFWYRLELLKRLQLTWRDVGTQKCGVTSLKDMPLTLSMLRALKADAIDVQYTITSNEDDHPVSETGDGAFNVSMGEFYKIKVIATNRSDRPMAMTARLSALMASPQQSEIAVVGPSSRQHAFDRGDQLTMQNMLIDGTAARRLSSMEESESSTTTFTVCFLSQGRYELVCRVNEEGDDSQDGSSHAENTFIAVVA